MYEHRLGRRGQYELFAQDVDEIGGAYKHVILDSYRRGSIVAGGGEIKFNDSGAVFEVFAAFSQALPFLTDGFMHAHTGVEMPSAKDALNGDTKTFESRCTSLSRFHNENEKALAAFRTVISAAVRSRGRAVSSAGTPRGAVVSLPHDAANNKAAATIARVRQSPTGRGPTPD